MRVKLVEERKLYLENWNDNNGLETFVLEKDSVINICVVTEYLAKECEIFAEYVGKFYIDLDKLGFSDNWTPDHIECLILDYNDFYDADIKSDLDELCKQLGITQEQIDEVAAMSSKERLDMLDSLIEQSKVMSEDLKSTCREIREQLKK